MLRRGGRRRRVSSFNYPAQVNSRGGVWTESVSLVQLDCSGRESSKTSGGWPAALISDKSSDGRKNEDVWRLVNRSFSKNIRRNTRRNDGINTTEIQTEIQRDMQREIMKELLEEIPKKYYFYQYFFAYVFRYLL